MITPETTALYADDYMLVLLHRRYVRRHPQGTRRKTDATSLSTGQDWLLGTITAPVVEAGA